MRHPTGRVAVAFFLQRHYVSLIREKEALHHEMFTYGEKRLFSRRLPLVLSCVDATFQGVGGGPHPPRGDRLSQLSFRSPIGSIASPWKHSVTLIPTRLPEPRCCSPRLTSTPTPLSEVLNSGRCLRSAEHEYLLVQMHGPDLWARWRRSSE